MAKILVIDDEQAIVDLLSLRLKEAGHQVVAAMDGMTGQMVASREKPDLIILDYNMPAANGSVVHARLRGNMNTAAVPIIFLTATPIGEIVTSVKDDELTRFLDKPVDFAFLAKTIASFLPSGAPLPPAASAQAPEPAEPYDPDDPNSVGGGETIDLD